MLSVRPTGRALVVASLGLVPALLPVVGVAGGGLVWGIGLALVALALVTDFLLCPRASRLDLEVAAPATITIAPPGRRPRQGETREADSERPGRTANAGHLMVTLRLPTRGRIAAELLPEFSPELERVEARGFRVPAMSSSASAGPSAVEVDFPLRPLRRGRARLVELWAAWTGPLGLVRRTTVRRPPLRVDITPDLDRVRRETLENLSQKQALPGQRVERYLGQGSEFHALREWIPGMERRSVDWKASARHTRLLAREVRAERNHQIVVAVDTGRLMAEPLHGVPRLDHAIHAALVLAATGLRGGDRVGLFAFDDQAQAYAPPRAGRDTLAGLMRTAAGLEYSTAETAFALAFADLARRLRRRSLVVVMTDFVDSIAADLMIDTLSHLARRQLVVFVAFRDPVLADLVTVEPRRRRDLDRAVVAGALARDRRRVLRRLARAGVHVVDTEPEAMGPALVDRYLEIKRREMI